jgi:phospholipid/cholesterol/gamma-HCH transport system substrate-binding protein
MSRLLAQVRALRPAMRIVVAAVAALVVLVVGAGVATAGGSGGTHHITAYFTRTIGLYNGNDVRILGVRVGKITSIKVKGPVVEVKMTVDGQYKLPADVGAVVVPPSVVSDRYIQLTPAYSGGPQLPTHAVLNTDRTQVPLEFDEIFKNLDKLNNALGPNGANSNGALSRLVDVSAANLGGNGAQLNGALKEFSAMITALSGSRGDLFSTLKQLQTFTTMLAQNDGGVRAVNANLAKVGAQLAGERKDLGAALANLSQALQLVSSFVADNKTRLTSDIHKAAAVTNVLSKEKEALQQIIDLAPYALTNLSLAYDSTAQTLDTLDGAGQVFSQGGPVGPNSTLCQLAGDKIAQLCTAAAATRAKSLADLLAVKTK